MPGIRIHHPTERNCVLLVRHPGEFRRGLRTYNRGRKPKDYYIHLDKEGDSIVSEVVLKRLQEANASFIILNEVVNPPAQIQGFEPQEIPAIRREIEGAIKEITPPGMKARMVQHG